MPLPETKKMTLPEYIKGEALQRNLDPMVVLDQFRQRAEDDDEQDRFELYENGLEIIQEEAHSDIEMWDSEIEYTKSMGGDCATVGPPPPFPTKITAFLQVTSHAGWAGSRQEMQLEVICDDGQSRLLIWTSIEEGDCDYPDVWMDWYSLEHTKEKYFGTR